MFLSSCTYSVHQFNAGDVVRPLPLEKMKLINAEGEQFSFLGFTFDTNYVLEAVEKLNEKCPGGEIQGINTRFSTAHGFLSWRNKVHLEGFCIPGS